MPGWTWYMEIKDMSSSEWQQLFSSPYSYGQDSVFKERNFPLATKKMTGNCEVVVPSPVGGMVFLRLMKESCRKVADLRTVGEYLLEHPEVLWEGYDIIVLGAVYVAKWRGGKPFVPIFLGNEPCLSESAVYVNVRWQAAALNPDQHRVIVVTPPRK